MTTEKEYTYIRFNVFFNDVRKTHQWTCRGSDDSILGIVKWHGAWRQYCFYTTNPHAIFHDGCLADLTDFLRIVNAEYKAQKREERKAAS